MNVKAYAKINITLDVVGKRPDGYHEIETVMQSVSLCDEIELEKADQITLSCSVEELADDNNLAYLAAKRFFEKSGISGGVKIYIKKNIPLAAGLGGGSSDAAAVLKALNELYDYPLTQDALIKIALSLGADVPFCLCGGTVFATGVGELMTGLKNFPRCYIVISKKGLKGSTGQMYKALDTAEFKKRHDMDAVLEGIEQGDIEKIALGSYNCFEQVCDSNTLLWTREVMLQNGAVYSGLSGAGPSVIGVFKDLERAQKTAEQLSQLGAEVFVTQPVSADNI